MKRKHNTGDRESDDEIWNYSSQSQRRCKSSLSLNNCATAEQSSSASVIARHNHSRSESSGCQAVTLNESLLTSDPQLFENAKSNRVTKIPRRDQVNQSLEKSQNWTSSSQNSVKSKIKFESKTPRTLAQQKMGERTEEKFDKPASSELTADAAKYSGNCPQCQVPFCALMADSPRWHVMECMDLPINAREECPAGVHCDSTIPSHYRRFTHNSLAYLRAGAELKQISTEVRLETVSRRLNFVSGSHTSTSVEDLPFTATSASLERQENGDSLSVELQERCVSSYFKSSQSSAESTSSKRHRPIAGNFEDFDSVSSSPSVITGISMFKNSQDGATAREKGLRQQSVQLPFGAIMLKQSPCTRLSKGLCLWKSELEIETKDEILSDEDIFDSGDKTSSPSPKADLFGAHIKINQPYKDLCAKVDEGRDDAGVGESLLQDVDLSELLADTFADDKESVVMAANDTDEEAAITGPSQKGSCDLECPGNAMKIITNFGASPAATPRGKTPRKTPQSRKKTPRSGMKTRASIKRESGGKRQTSIHSFFKCANSLSGMGKRKSRLIEEINADEQETSKPRVSTSKDTSVLSKSSVASTAAWHKLRSTAKPYSLKHCATSNAGVSDLSGYSSSDSSVQGSDKNDKNKKQCPFYKKVEGTPFVVDAFSYGTIPGVKGYFLSHFHSDHYYGLRKSFAQPLYCSQITAKLVQKNMRVNSCYLHPLAMDMAHVVNGVEVTLLEANHCPGSVLLLFRLRDGRVMLHTGDFRASTEMEMYPHLQGVQIDTLYLDTTYCDPAYAFPPQQDVINFAANVATDFVHQHPNALVVVGSYTIGKERIFKAIAEALNCKVCVTKEKKAILDCLDDAELNRRITLRAKEAGVHVLPMRQLNPKDLWEYRDKLKLHFDHVLAFQPTGWTHSQKGLGLENLRPRTSRDGIVLYGVPYSEHSSYEELRRFIEFTRPRRILPTVNNGNPASRHKMEQIFKKWQSTEPQGKILRQTAIRGWFPSKS